MGAESITDEMIEAGAAIIRDYFDAFPPTARGLARDIYLAMKSHASRSSETQSSD
jgi:hypothetical protein